MHSVVHDIITIACCALGGPIIPSSAAADIRYLPTPGRAAFIGNSLTLSNNGSDNVLMRLGDAETPPLQLTINKDIQTGGCYLSCHWEDPAKIAAVTGGRFDMVILQEGGDLTYSAAEDDAAQFYRYAQKWADTIRSSGATPALYMMWAWRDDTGSAMLTKTNHQAAEYDSAARLIRAKVIPIGRGYHKLRNDTSAIAKSIGLFDDYQHPTCCATYFIGCICFCALYGSSPVGNAYLGDDMSGNGSAPTTGQARALQQIAWDTWCEYGDDDSGRGYAASYPVRPGKAALPSLSGTGRMPELLIGIAGTVHPGAIFSINGARISRIVSENPAVKKTAGGVFVSVHERKYQ